MEHELGLYLSPTQTEYVYSDKVVNVIVSNTGEGKCWKRDTQVMKFDGTTIPVQDVVVGDLLMGDDSLPRTVLALGCGEGEMFEIIPTKGESFIVNGPHILPLKRTNTTLNPDKNGEIVHITVEDYINQPPTFKHLHKLFRVGVDFPEQMVPLPPYLLGLWLGDGTSIRAEITTADSTIVSYLQEQAREMGVRLVEKIYRTNSVDTNKSKGYQFSGEVDHKGKNPFVSFLNEYNLIDNKHIPHIYKANSRENRLQLLAGLLDTDGWINHEGYQTIQKNQRLAEGIAFLARSLGLAAYISPRKKHGFGIEGTYYHVMISGDCSCIPVKLERKKCTLRKQKKDVLVTGIKEIKPLGMGDYFGFTLDGNHRFLLGDFTVTHNTYASIAAILGHSMKCGRPIRVAIVRDTLENIKLSTARSIMEFFEDYPRATKWKNECRQLTIFGPHRIDVDLFGIDDLGALSKLQGPEYALIWLEEPAPMADKVNAGLSEEVFNAALVRCARQKGTQARLQISMNPADEEHWTFRRFIEEPDIDPENPLITKQVWFVPYGENRYVSETSRQAVKSAYKDDPASYSRYVLGQFAVIYQGEKVTPYYNRELHLLPGPAEPVRGLESFRLWDSWGYPACVLGQVTTIGRLIIYDCCYIDGNSDLRTLSSTQVEPLINSPRWRNKARSWRDIGDFTMAQRDQSNVEESAKMVIQRAFRGRFEPGPSTWRLVKQALDDMFQRNGLIQGLPSVQLDPVGARLLDRALNGAWHYPVDSQGKRSRTTPVKDAACVPFDTEILMLDGFKKYSDIREGETCYGWSDGELVDDTVLKLNIFNESSEVLEFDNQSISAAFTAPHRCLITRRVCPNGGKPRVEGPLVKRADEVNTADAFILTAPWRGRKAKDREFSDDFVRLAAWIMTEGHYRENGQFWISQKNYAKDVMELGLKFAGTTISKRKIGYHLPEGRKATTENAESFIHTIKIRHETAYILEKLMPNKSPSPEFIRMMTAGQRRHFLYEAMRGDGTTNNKWETLKENPGRNRDMGLGGAAWRIALADTNQVDSIQYLCATLGLRTSVANKKNYYLVTIWSNNGRCQVGKITQKNRTVDGVWCPTTTSGFWVARRNGKIFITGNSHLGDAFANGCAVLRPSAKKADIRKMQDMAIKNKRRTQSYAVGGGIN